MIRHALTEGFLLLSDRVPVSAVLALALAVPITLAGVGVAVNRWLQPVAELGDQKSTVAVLLHPQMDLDQRQQWMAAQSEAHPEWSVSEVPSEELVARLQRWFPYLEDLVVTGDTTMPPLVEVTTSNQSTLSHLEIQPEVLAVGPQSSIQQALGRVARRLSLVIAGLSTVLLAAAALLAAVWVHLELYRHADELTIMRLVGATEATIRGPFVVAVGVPGVAAGVVAIIGSVGTANFLSRIVGALGMPDVVMTPGLLVAEMVGAVALPVVAAVVTLSRHAADQFDG